MLKLYGSDGRSFRSAWMLEEADLAYERIPIRFKDAASNTDYLKLNPNGKIPALDDSGFVIFESLAINLYIARKYGTPLWPEGLEDQTSTVQWMAWALGELEGPHDAAPVTSRPKLSAPM